MDWNLKHLNSPLVSAFNTNSSNPKDGGLTCLHKACSYPSLVLISELLSDPNTNPLVLDDRLKLPSQHLPDNYLSSSKIIKQFERSKYLAFLKIPMSQVQHDDRSELRPRELNNDEELHERLMTKSDHTVMGWEARYDFTRQVNAGIAGTVHKSRFMNTSFTPGRNNGMSVDSSMSMALMFNTRDFNGPPSASRKLEAERPSGLIQPFDDCDRARQPNRILDTDIDEYQSGINSVSKSRNNSPPKKINTHAAKAVGKSNCKGVSKKELELALQQPGSFARLGEVFVRIIKKMERVLAKLEKTVRLGVTKSLYSPVIQAKLYVLECHLTKLITAIRLNPRLLADADNDVHQYRDTLGKCLGSLKFAIVAAAAEPARLFDYTSTFVLLSESLYFVPDLASLIRAHSTDLCNALMKKTSKLAITKGASRLLNYFSRNH